jgi:hypothetical protein
MGRYCWLAVGLALAFTAAAPAADETYSIKIKEPGPGAVLQVEASGKSDRQSKLLGADDKVLHDEEQSGNKALVFRETILEKDPGRPRPSKLKRAYEKAQVTENGKTTTLPYEGKTVLIEKKGKEYQFRTEGGDELTGKDARLLDEEFNKAPEEDLEKAFLPKKPVAVNESWKVDVAAFVAAYARSTKMPVDAARAEGTGKLLKVYTKDGARFGIVNLHLEMPLKEGKLGESPNQMTLNAGGKWTVDIALDGCIDGSRAAGSRKGVSQFHATGEIALPPDGKPGKVVLSAKTTARETTDEVKK